MATILLKSYAISEINPWGPTINLHLAGDNPFPTERIEVTKLAEVRAAFDAYVERARATGKKMQLSPTVFKGRKPAGFDGIEDVCVNV